MTSQETEATARGSADDRTTPAETHLSQVIVLGASNVTQGLPWLIDNLHAGFGGPVSLFAAIGHGRSYGARSRVLIRELPGILQCRLWSRIDECDENPRGRFALLTDIGNDLLYGFDVETIVSWLAESIQRLRDMHAECIMTRLPLASVLRMSAARYYATRALFFPGSRVNWPDMQRRAVALDEAIERLGSERSIAVIEPRAEWYGFDPIHIRFSRRNGAWNHIFSAWSAWDPRVGVHWPHPTRLLRNLTFAAEERKLAGRALTRPQPIYRNERLTLRLY